MSNAMSHETEKQAPRQQTVVQDIDRYLVDGLPVYDLNNENVGDVKMYGTAAGYLMVGAGAFEHKDLYIPFRLIRSIDPHDIFVSETKAALEASFTQPPQTHTVVETRLVLGPHGGTTSQTREVQVLRSGYDDAPTELNPIEVSSIADRLAVGMVVYDANGKRLGDVTQYDTFRSLMMVEKGLLKPRAVLVPFSAIKDIDLDTSRVNLTFTEDTLLKDHAMLPTSG